MSGSVSMEVVASSSRKSFDSAYANLEATVRNFSRDKMSYEDLIKKLKLDLEGKDETLKKNALLIENLLSENENLLSAHEEDVAARASMDALMYTVSMKQDLFSKTVDDFEVLEKEILERYQAAEVFMESVKGGHNKLMEKLTSLEQDLLKETMHSKDVQNQLQNVHMRLEDTGKKLEEERRATHELQGRLGKVNQQLEGRTEELKQERNMTMQLQNVIIGVKNELEVKEQGFRDKEKQLMSVQETLKHEITDTKGKLDEISQKLESSTQELKEERESSMKFQEMLINVRGELEVKEKALHDTEEKLTSVRESLQQEISDTKGQLDQLNKQLESCTLDLKQEKDLTIQLQETLTNVKVELEVKEQSIRDTEERLNSLQQSLQKQVNETQAKLDDVNQQLECSTQELTKEKELTASLQEALASVKDSLEVKEQAIRENEERFTSLQHTLQQEIADITHRLDEVNKQLEFATQELKQEKEMTAHLEVSNAQLKEEHAKAISSISALESSRKTEAERYAVEIQEQIDAVEGLKSENKDLSGRLESLQLEKKNMELSLMEELAKKDETIRIADEALALTETQVHSLKNDLLKRDAEHKKKMEGLKQYLDSEKTMSTTVATPRKSAPVAAVFKKVPAPPTPTAPSTPISARHNEQLEHSTPSKNPNRSILKRSCSRMDNNKGNVSFNYNVNVRKFNPKVFNISSSSDSEDSQRTVVMPNQKQLQCNTNANASVPPVKKSKISQKGDGDIPQGLSVSDKENIVAADKEKATGKDIDNLDFQKENNENDVIKSTEPSPKKFFTKSKPGQGPMNSPVCKGPRMSPMGKSSHSSHHQVHGIHKSLGAQSFENSRTSLHSKSIARPAK